MSAADVGSLEPLTGQPVRRVAIKAKDGTTLAIWRGASPESTDPIADALDETNAFLRGMGLAPIRTDEIAEPTLKAVSPFGHVHHEIVLHPPAQRRGDIMRPAFPPISTTDVLATALRCAAHACKALPAGKIIAGGTTVDQSDGNLEAKVTLYRLVGDDPATWLRADKPLRLLMTATLACAHANGREQDLCAEWDIPDSATLRARLKAQIAEEHAKERATAAAVLGRCGLSTWAEDLPR